MSFADYYRSPELFLNVLFLDDDPKLAAQAHADRHLGKAVMDTAQILSSAWFRADRDADGTLVAVDWAQPNKETPYREHQWLQTTLNGRRILNVRMERHPCVDWALLYGGNYEWLYKFGSELVLEFRHRYDRIHSAQPIIRALELVPPKLLDTTDKYCDPPMMFPNAALGEDAATGYRRYYNSLDMLRYRRRQPPAWARNAVEEVEHAEE